ncbi:MAG: glycosyltransferase, partial [Candidatus Moranbacteria bacterium]|nr:glycosyltransferase [Candidatus Moranbacteria bacterium]
MRILVLNYEYPPLGGGGGVFSRDLSEEWSKMGIKIDVITSGSRKLSKIEKKNKVRVYRVWSRERKKIQSAGFLNLLFFVISGFFKTRSLMKKRRYDFVHTHFAIPTGVITYLLSFLYKNKYILTIHGADIYDPSRLMSGHKFFLTRFLVAKIINRSDKVIASSREIQEKAYRYFKIKKQIKIIPLGFKSTQDKTAIDLKKAKKRHSNQKIKLITIGRLVKRKNLKFLIKALKKVDQRFVLNVVGGGPMESDLRQYVKSLNLEKKIKVLGRVSERRKAELLKEADIYVSTAMHEGFG